MTTVNALDENGVKKRRSELLILTTDPKFNGLGKKMDKRRWLTDFQINGRGI